MIIAGHQSNYLPYPGFFKKIFMSDSFIIMENLQFEKKSWQNRNRVQNQGNPLWLTVPVLTKNKFYQKIKDVEINQDIPWQKKHYRTIQLNYGKTPFYKDIEPLLNYCYMEKTWKKLSDLNRFWIQKITALLNIKTPLSYDENYDFSGKKTDLLISICKNTGYNCYLSSPNSAGYVEGDKFIHNDLMHFYMRYEGPVSYHLESKEIKLIPDLSIIDLICRVGKNNTEKIIKSHTNYYQKVETFNWLLAQEG